MSNKYNLLIFFSLILLTSAIIISFAYLLFQKQSLEKSTSATTPKVAITPAATPFVPNSSQLSYTGTVNQEDCGTQNTKSPFSITLPAGWSLKKADTPDYYQNYSLFGPQGSINIACFKTFQATTCKPDATQKTITIGSTTIQACIEETDKEISFEFADLTSPQGNTFDFGGNITDKQILNQILSTFKFTQ